MSEQADAAAVSAAKRMLRQAVRLRRDRRSPEQREMGDQQRFGRLVERLSPRPPARLAAYLSTGTEPDSLRLVAWAVAHEIEVLLPVLTDGAGSWLPTPAWARYEGPDRLREGRSQILEPTGPPRPRAALDSTDLLVLPGLAGDPVGNRLGRGGGWYDRARAGHSGLPAWLLLNDDEVLDAVPTSDWDLPVDLIVTPARTLVADRRRTGGR